MVTQYGLDANYVSSVLNRINHGVGNATPAEMSRMLTQLALTVHPRTVMEELTYHTNNVTNDRK